MVWSLGAVFGVVALLLAISYRPHAQTVQVVDYQGAIETATSASNWPILVPSSIPTGYSVTNARFEPETYGGNGDARWYLGLSDFGTNYISLWQSDGLSNKVIAAATNHGDCQTTVQIQGVTWDKCEVAEPLTRSFVRIVDTQTIVVSGTATWNALEAFASSLSAQPLKH